MGLSKPSVEFTLRLYKEGFFKGFKSVIELGAQDFHFQPRQKLYELLQQKLDIDQGIIVNEFNKALEKSTADDFHPDWFYHLLGFEMYRCIDADGRHDAFVWDLNFPIPDEHKGKYDLVTDHGTSEHVFNVYQAFKNIHDLAHKSSVIIQMLPFQGHVDHGFFNFQPCFFEDLAFENDYEILKKAVVIYHVEDNAESAQIIPYTKESFKETYFQDKGSEAIFAIAMRRRTNKDFKIPFHGIYGSSCLIPFYRRSFIQSWFQKLAVILLKNKNSVVRKIAKLAKKILEKN